MIRYITLVIIILVINSLYADKQKRRKPANSPNQEWLSFNPQAKQDFLTYKTKQLSFENFHFAAYTPGLYIQPIAQDNRIFKKLMLKGGITEGKIGKPGIPGFTRMVLIPKGAKISFKVNQGKMITLDNYLLYPVQKIIGESEQTPEKEFSFDLKFYKTDAYHPKSLVSVDYEWIRGCQVAIIRVHTARYNPRKQSLLYYPELGVDIKFTGGTKEFIPVENRSRFFEATYNQLFPNYKTDPVSINSIMHAGSFFNRCDMLIITPQVLLTYARTLADWKEEKGIITRIATLEEIETDQGGITAHNIRTYIRNVYTSANLSYVLLFGDADVIPPHYRTFDSASETLVGTDHYYAEMDMSGYLPDLAVGRISVQLPSPEDTVDQAATVINKIIQYEKKPPLNHDFYDRILHLAYFEDKWGGSDTPGFWASDGQAEKWFTETMEELRDFFRFRGYRHLPRKYATDMSIWPEGHTGPQRYRDGSSLPGDILWPGFSWDDNATGINNELEKGAFLTLFRGHGDEHSWRGVQYSSPGVLAEGLKDLDNGSLTPVVLSITCKTGWFDNETIAYSLSSDDWDCFAEDFLRADGGAVAIVASSRESSGYSNNFLIKGYVDCIWTNMDHTYPGVDDVSAILLEGSHRIGDALNYAKLYMKNTLNSSFESSNKIMFEIYHLFGDPSLEIWTHSPYPEPFLPPFHPALIQPIYILGELYYQIPLEIEGVIASLMHKNYIIGQGISEQGQVKIKVDKPLKSLQDIRISLNKTGYHTQVLPVAWK